MVNRNTIAAGVSQKHQINAVVDNQEQQTTASKEPVTQHEHVSKNKETEPATVRYVQDMSSIDCPLDEGRANPGINTEEGLS